jgi:type I restriction enzyme, S subunit
MSKKVKLISICKPKQYKTLSKIDLIENGKFPVYGANGIIGKSDKFTHENPTLMVTCRGATCGTLNISEPNSYINGNAMAFDDINEEFDLKYLYYYLFTRGFNDVISGSAQPQITRENLKNLEVLKPLLEKQKQIAKILDKANELIELRKESITKLDALAKSIFIDMFGDPVSNSKKWKTTLLNDIGIWKGGGTPSRTNSDYFSGDIPWITTVSLGNLYIDESNAVELITNEAISKSSTKLIPKNSIIIGTRVGVGKVSINKVGICTNQDIISIINIHKNFNNIFIVFFIKSYNEVLNAFKRGATIQGITSANLKNIDLINPPIELQNKFAKIIEKIEEQKSLYTQELEKLQENFDALLQKSFQ